MMPLLQDKTTVLTDQHDRILTDLRVSVTSQCQQHCLYCRPQPPESCRTEEPLAFSEILSLVRILAEQGVRKVRITGGEPLLRPGLPDFIFKLRAIPGIDDIALTTNGILLSTYARSLRAAGLDRLTVSLDTVHPVIYQRITQSAFPLSEVLAGMDAARKAGFQNLKINAVMMKGVNDHAVLDLVDHFRFSGNVLRLIEYMDAGRQNGWQEQAVIPAAELVEQIDRVWPLDPVSPLSPRDVASRFRFRDGAGEIGVIASVTQPFCKQCSRLRLTAQGQLLTCLFAEQTLDVRPLLRPFVRTDALRSVLLDLWRNRDDRYSDHRDLLNMLGHKREKMEMYKVGG